MRAPGPPGELDDLALDPEERHLLDVLADLHREQADRPRVLGRGVGGPLRQRGPRRRAHGRNSRRDPRQGPSGRLAIRVEAARDHDGGMADSTKRVLLAAPRGYCAGVDRAVVTVEKALDLYGPPGLRAQADRPQQARRDDPREPRRGVRRRDRRGARGRDRRLLGPRRGAGRARGGQGAAPAHHRRDLPAGHQGAPRGGAVRRRRLRHPAHRPRGPRGGRRHRRGGARAHPARRRPGRRRRTSRCGTPRRWSGCPRRRCRSTRRWRPCAGCASASPACRTRRATTSATPPRTASSRSSRWPPSATS